MMADDTNVESHFVENPFIRVRERANKKQLDAKNMLKASNLEDDEDQDIILLKEAGKFFIRDLEQAQQDKHDEKQKKRKRADVDGYGDGDEIDSDFDEEEEKIGSIHRKLKEVRHRKPSTQQSDANNKFKTAVSMKKRDLKALSQGGHIVKASGDQYKSTKGKGDVLKAGTHEPYAYIKLNPDMLNPKKKQLAVQSFAGVVSHGKKTDKRTMKRKEGMLAGMSAKM